MQYNEVQIQEFKRLFAIRRKRQLAIVPPFVLMGVGIAFIDRGTQTLFGIPAIVIAPVFLLLMGVGFYFTLKNWRCPACDKYLGKGHNPYFCPKCGVPLK